VAEHGLDPSDPFRGGYTLHLHKGTNHLDGKAALAVARTRENLCAPSETDIQREEHQQALFTAVKQRLFSPSSFLRLPWIAWNAPPALCAALSDADFQFISSARDLRTPVSPDARAAMSGLHGASLIQPMRIGCARGAERTNGGANPREVVHITTNFQATSTLERARAVIESGGLLSTIGRSDFN